MVLIVEDEAVSRKALAHILRLHGHQARAAESGEDANGPQAAPSGMMKPPPLSATDDSIIRLSAMPQSSTPMPCASSVLPSAHLASLPRNAFVRSANVAATLVYAHTINPRPRAK